MSTTAAPDRSDDLLRGFGDHLGLPGLCFDNHGHCCIAFDAVMLNLERDRARGEILAYADLAAFEPDRHTPILPDYLEANHFAALTGYGSLGLDRQGGRFHLSARVPAAGLTPATFQAFVREFVERAEGWQALIEDRSPADGTDGLSGQDGELSLEQMGLIRI